MEHKWSESLETDGNLSVPLAELLVEGQPWLFQERGFRIVHSEYEPQHFGNSLVLLQSDTLRLRFVRDRGQVLVALGSPSDPEDWWGLISLCEVIQNSAVKPRYKLDVLASLLRDNFPALEEAMGPKRAETKKEIERHRQERLKALQQPSR
jgi:hypothetical protein